METHPEQVKVMMADINNNYQLLQSLAKKVEQVEGRGQPKVSFFFFFLLCTDYPAVRKVLDFTHLSIKMFKHLTFPGGKHTRITLYPTGRQKLPLV